MLVVERLVVRDARAPSVDLGATQLLGRDVLAGRGLHERRPAQEDRAGPLHDDGLVAHRRHVRAAGRARAHDERDLRDPGRRHPRLVVEDPAEMVAVGEDVGLEGQERAAAVDEVDAGQPVLQRDLLGAQMLLHGHRVVRAALDGRVVGDDDARRAFDLSDAGDDAGARRVVVVQAVGGERTELEECRPGIDQPVDAIADRQLAAFPMTLDGCVIAAGSPIGELRLASPQLFDERRHRVVVRARLRRARVQPTAQHGHGPDDRSAAPSYGALAKTSSSAASRVG